MPRGRPKVVVAPCRHCGRQFKRQEHLLRHERSRREEDQVVQPFPHHDTTDLGVGDPDLFWDPDFITHDMLPAMLFDTDMSLADPPLRSNPQPSLTSSFSRFTSGLPSLDATAASTADEDPNHDDQAESTASLPGPVPWSITGLGYESFCQRVQAYSEVLPSGCALPSRNTLARNLEAYFRCVQEHLPFVHAATFSVERKDVELVLAAAALGAQTRFDSPKCFELYYMAKAILFENTRREDLQLSSDLLSGKNHSILDRRIDVAKIQTFALLISFASWSDLKILPDALSMAGQLATLARVNGTSELDPAPLQQQQADWSSWVTVEERRRSLYAAYVLFNLHTIAFDTPPLILNQEVGIMLPSSAELWKATNAIQWHQCGGGGEQVDRPFKVELQSLCDGDANAGVSSFSNYLLIHGLLQQIYVDRHGSTGSSLGCETRKALETALRTWQRSWELTHESTLDPLSPKGPLGFTAASLLRHAYIWLSSDGPIPNRGLLRRDLRCLVGNDRHYPTQRLPHLDRAVLHAVHALAVPVRLGIELITRARQPFWTIEHSLCSLECALLLQRWLETMAATVRSCGSIEKLRQAEQKLLHIIAEVIKETFLSDTLAVVEDDDASRVQRMATTVVQLWARIFQFSHALDVDDFIAAGLKHLSDMSSTSPI
ncbi:hypothetical protein A1O3_09765 [Capronia epimyces CBS 606.96]|uniref:C2H2-type domain-containing protein n=1 Tax=Capronia epimyces CBS 606.96 TaxID=1182542 RepID=W9XBE9_9EURO|nr:uncharacterized protein A1O3_09765 [Capronia epimyces CBS 606.96]EXJ77538.1 hypothetical protein A1O3_09765 [Capronia epimyces CBS 606.96]